LKEAGIGTGIHYPVPLHVQRAYRVLNYQKGDFPQCERAAREILSLPMYPQLTTEQQVCVAKQVLRFTATASRQASSKDINATAGIVSVGTALAAAARLDLKLREP
jgi:hypothetical protein